MSNEIKTVKIHKVSFEKLPDDEKALLEAACKVRNNAQAPYSHYHVGVAILSNKGTTHIGCNVERCTYTQTTHAEQNAIDTMIAAEGSSKIEKIAVVGAQKNIQINVNQPSIIPLSNKICGHCLQIIWENCYADPKVKILNFEGNGIASCTTIADLLPFSFGPENLNIFL